MHNAFLVSCFGAIIYFIIDQWRIQGGAPPYFTEPNFVYGFLYVLVKAKLAYMPLNNRPTYKSTLIVQIEGRSIV